jgi:hypothetical protein
VSSPTRRRVSLPLCGDVLQLKICTVGDVTEGRPLQDIRGRCVGRAGAPSTIRVLLGEGAVYSGVRAWVGVIFGDVAGEEAAAL